jgi:hypothetical protein
VRYLVAAAERYQTGCTTGLTCGSAGFDVGVAVLLCAVHALYLCQTPSYYSVFMSDVVVPLVHHMRMTVPTRCLIRGEVD